MTETKPVAWMVTYQQGDHGQCHLTFTEPDPEVWDTITPLYTLDALARSTNNG